MVKKSMRIFCFTVVAGFILVVSDFVYAEMSSASFSEDSFVSEGRQSPRELLSILVRHCSGYSKENVIGIVSVSVAVEPKPEGSVTANAEQEYHHDEI